LKSVVPYLAKLGTFSAGQGPALFELNGIRLAPNICYEAVFPELVRKSVLAGGDIIVNLTNDGWFGHSSGPYQHLQQARVRAVEEGLPLVRAANTGVSAVIDPAGRIVRSLPLGAEGVLDAPLPRALEPTIYGRLRDGPLALLMLAGLGVLLWRRARTH
jgi:apolipoprotein N-acyltransferase